MEVFKKTLTGGFSCINTRLGFDTEILLPNYSKADLAMQYGYAMTKPLPTGSIKQREKIQTWREFNLLLESVDLDDKIGHLFVIDIRFNKEEAIPKEFMYNEIY